MENIMRIADSILSDHLKHVYWITGGPCAGKTTVTNLLAEKYGLSVFPDRHSEYQQIADKAEFPAMRIPWPGTDWEWFFNRPTDEYVRWLEESLSAELEFQIVDLLKTSDKERLIVDTCADPLALHQISAPSRVICLFGDDDLIRRDLLHRDDHKMILDCIRANTASPETSERLVAESGVEFSHRLQKRAEASEGKILRRTDRTAPDELLARVEKHFRLI
jgi:hypothetical protein